MNGKHTEVYLVRHGETDSNIAGLFHGATDVPLNTRGRRQAELVAERVARLGGLDSLHSSPLQRALVTARAIATLTDLTPVIHPGLAEMHFGEAEGLTFDAMYERFEDLTPRFQDLNDHDARFPGGESRREFHARVRDALDAIVARHAGERLVVVSHAGVIGSLVAQVLGGDPNDWQQYQVANCSVTHLELHTNGPIAHIVNDTTHLDGFDIEAVHNVDAAGR